MFPAHIRLWCPRCTSFFYISAEEEKVTGRPFYCLGCATIRINVLRPSFPLSVGLYTLSVVASKLHTLPVREELIRAFGECISSEREEQDEVHFVLGLYQYPSVLETEHLEMLTGAKEVLRWSIKQEEPLLFSYELLHLLELYRNIGKWQKQATLLKESELSRRYTQEQQAIKAIIEQQGLSLLVLASGQPLLYQKEEEEEDETNLSKGA